MRNLFNSKSLQFTQQNTGKSLVYFQISFLLLLILGLYLRFDCFEATRITEWVARDFDRSFHLFDGDYIPLAGPERNGGGRLLGPFLYFFTAIPLFFHYSYESIYFFNFLLNVFSLLFFIWIVNRFFGNTTAYFSGAFLSISVIHIDMAGFPINPAFMFPFSLLFLGLLLEFTFNKKLHYFSWILLVVSLAIQIHFSIATYYLTVFAILCAFKIKLNWKLVLKTFGLLIICFLPYLLYKNQFYEPNIQITKTFFNQEYSAIGLIKSALLGNLLFRLNQGTSLYEYYSFPTYFAQLQFLILSISFYGLTAITIWDLRKKSFNSCKENVFILLSFYIPGIIYEIMNPPTGWHFWHYFIFIAPAILIKGRFFYLIFSKLKQKSFRFFIFLLTQCLFLFIGTSIINYVKQSHYLTSTNIRTGDFYSSKRLKDFIGEAMDLLKLSPKEFYENVYIEGISAESKYNLKLSHKNIIYNRNKTPNKNLCYYLFKKQKVSRRYPKSNPSAKQKLSWFLSDPSINLLTPSSYPLVVKGKKTVKVFDVYTYSTKLGQPCYRNQFNRFLVDPETREYLKQSFNINKNNRKNSVWKTISNDIKFDSNSNLEKLNQTSIAFDKKINTPIQVKTNIEIINNELLIQNKLRFYAWALKENKFQIKEAVLKISENAPNTEKTEVSFQLLDPKSWITNPKVSKTSANFSWSREFRVKTPFPLKKDQFKLELTIRFFFPQKKDSCCEMISLIIPIEEYL